MSALRRARRYQLGARSSAQNLLLNHYSSHLPGMAYTTGTRKAELLRLMFNSSLLSVLSLATNPCKVVRTFSARRSVSKLLPRKRLTLLSSPVSSYISRVCASGPSSSVLRCPFASFLPPPVYATMPGTSITHSMYTADKHIWAFFFWGPGLLC